MQRGTRGQARAGGTGGRLPWWPKTEAEVPEAPGLLFQPEGSPSSNSPGRPGWPRSPPPGVGLQGGWGRVAAELPFLTFAAAKLLCGCWRWAAAPQQLPGLRVGGKSRDRPGKSLGHRLGRGDASVSFPVALLQDRPSMLLQGAVFLSSGSSPGPWASRTPGYGGPRWGGGGGDLKEH